MESRRELTSGIVIGIVIGLLTVLVLNKESIVAGSVASVVLGLSFIKQSDWREGGLWGFVIAFVVGFASAIEAGNPGDTWKPAIFMGIVGAAAGLVAGAIFFLCRQHIALMAKNQ